MSLPDSTLRGRIADILNREGASKSAARQIQDLMASEQRLVDLKNAPDALGISRRTFYRRLSDGSVKTVMAGGRRMVDLLALNGTPEKMTTA